MGDTYRETALEQAVISHGKHQEFDGMTSPRDRSDLVVLSQPNDPAEVVKAAAVYERFLDRSSLLDSAVTVMDQLAAALAPLAEEADGTEFGAIARTAVHAWKQWKSLLDEPF